VLAAAVEGRTDKILTGEGPYFRSQSSTSNWLPPPW
jgi:hypothetical protein